MLTHLLQIAIDALGTRAAERCGKRAQARVGRETFGFTDRRIKRPIVSVMFNYKIVVRAQPARGMAATSLVPHRDRAGQAVQPGCRRAARQPTFT
ncbi:hypothetical protein D7S89_06940 [Trinickia fusca]|uniref:Uncharacterized protein n=1 Tax=Trinickia fusca TaxID=2419777 RepID=A0A494XPU9_9BURK|nr:hypothetical protein D7S89_06940 [Trinickia fusca]